MAHLADARLSFFQKATLLPAAGFPGAFVKPGIIKLNSIRNRFGHNLEARIEEHELEAINVVLAISNLDVEFLNSIDRLEAFTTLACTWLLVSPPHIEEIFTRAFADVQLDILGRNESD